MMRNERFNDLDVSFYEALSGLQAKIWTALPAIVEDVDFDEMTVGVQPAIQSVFFDQNGITKNVTLPKLIKCLMCFPSAGGFSLTFPVKKDDEVLIIFSSRCIDAWWQQGDVQPQAEYRMHDLSDGFAIFAPKSLPKKINSISSNSVQLRNDSNTAIIEINDDANIIIKSDQKITIESQNDVKIDCENISITAQTQVEITAPEIKLNGSVDISNGGLTSGGIPYETHQHGGVQTGSGTTGGPL